MNQSASSQRAHDDAAGADRQMASRSSEIEPGSRPTNSRGLLSAIVGVLLLRPQRARRIYRERLKRIKDPTLPGQRMSALSEVGRFLADPRGYAPQPLAAALEWSLGGLADSGGGSILAAQAHALNGRFDEAIAAMERVIAQLDAAENDARSTPPWLAPALKGRLSDRAEKERRETRALACAFIASARLAKGDLAAQVDGLETSIAAEPGFAYLHEVRADVLMARGDFTDAFDVLDRAAALRGSAMHADAWLDTLIWLLISAIRSKWWWEDNPEDRVDGRTRAAALLDRAIARADAALDRSAGTGAESGFSRDKLATAWLWRGRAGLERWSLRDGLDTPSDDREKAKAALRKAVEALPSPVPPELANVSAWCAVAEERPWRALHDVIVRTPPAGAKAALGLSPLRNHVAVALLGVAGGSDAPHRLTLRMPADFLPDDDLADRLARGGDTDDFVFDLPAFSDAVKEHAGIEPPTVLISRITNAASGWVEVLLDGVLIGGASVDEDEGNREWFGTTRTMKTLAEAAVAVLAQAVMRHLDSLVTADHARALGVREYGYAAWSPVLRLLLADRTNLSDHEALRRAVADVAHGRASPTDAAEAYRRAIGHSISQAAPEAADVPAEKLARLRARVAMAGNGRAVEVPYEAAQAVETWVGSQTPELQSVAVQPSDAALRPYLRALLRPRYPDTAVMLPATGVPEL